MRRLKQLNNAIVAVLLVAEVVAPMGAAKISADPASAPSLVISQLKITSSNGQFITLFNASNTTLDLGKYQLEYFNNFDLGKATSSKLISLEGSLPPHGYLLVNDSSQILCYQLTVDSVSLGLSSTAGMVEVLAYNQNNPGGSVAPVLQDFVGWSKSAAAGAQTLPSSTNAWLQRLPTDPLNNPSVLAPGVGSWQPVQPSSGDACKLVAVGSAQPVNTGLTDLLPPTEPAATVMGGTEVESTGIPASNTGLMKPLITEILPNPAGNGNDAVDEFIELYNPNIIPFDLSGYRLQAGTTSTRSFTFAEGTTLPPQSYVTFYASATHLSLSNSSGQVKLLDPQGGLISATAVYGTAKDGQAWALANGKWYWTTQPTPGTPNAIVQPPKTGKAKASGKAASPKKAKATAAKTKKLKKAKVKTAAKRDGFPAASTNPIHSSTLAVLAGLALLYGAYEYRSDLANFFYKLRRNFKFGSSSRQ